MVWVDGNEWKSKARRHPLGGKIFKIRLTMPPTIIPVDSNPFAQTMAIMHSVMGTNLSISPRILIDSGAQDDDNDYEEDNNYPCTTQLKLNLSLSRAPVFGSGFINHGKRGYAASPIIDRHHYSVDIDS